MVGAQKQEREVFLSHSPRDKLPVAPSWAAETGCDSFGQWVRVDLRNVSFKMRRIPAGVFWMGAHQDDAARNDDEGPRHEVTLSEDFWLAEIPVTQELWQAVMGNNPSRLKGTARPVERVSWSDAQAFLQAVAGQVPGLRLPTEAQWEYACRAGSEVARHGELDAVAWHEGNSGGRIHPVGHKHPNAWSLHDMLGNVWEWCHDWYGPYGTAPVTDPTGAHSGKYRVVRGGSWDYSAREARAAFRDHGHPSDRDSDLGFRLSRNYDAPGK